MENQGQKQIVGAIIIAGILIAGAVLLKDSQPGEKTGEQAPTANTGNIKSFENINIRPINDDEHILGNKDAKIVIVEYSDLECPFCKVFHSTMHEVIKQKGEKVAWVYRHYPIPQLHSKATREAEATECAWEQGGNTAFWKYIDRVLEITPSNNGLEEKELTNIAQYLGLNTSSFFTCLESGKYKNKVQEDVNDGTMAGVSGTPSSFILVDGKIIDTIPGAQPLEMVLQRLDAIK